MIIREPAPTEVMPTISPPIMPMAMVGTGRTEISAILAVRCAPDLRSRKYRNTIAAAPASSAAPRAIFTFCWSEEPLPSRCSR
jgi:hypothetical protein